MKEEPTPSGEAVLAALTALVAERLRAAGWTPPTEDREAEGTYLSPAQLAVRLGRHEDTVRADLKAGRLPGTKIGRAWRTSLEELEAHLRGQGEQHVKDTGRVADARSWLRSQKAARKKA